MKRSRIAPGAALLASVALVALCCHARAATLVAHWELDDETGVAAADSAGANTGTLTGYAGDDSQWVQGKIGGGLYFDGQTNRVDVGSVGISGAAVRSISGWAKEGSLGQIDSRVLFGFAPNSSTTNAYFNFETGFDTENQFIFHTNGTTPRICDMDGGWHHLAATYDGTTIVVYTDGAEVWSDTIALVTIDEVYFGWRASKDRYFHGYLDDVRIYSDVLTVGEVDALSRQA